LQNYGAINFVPFMDHPVVCGRVKLQTSIKYPIPTCVQHMKISCNNYTESV